ncbi:hypothetical protein N0V92_011771 [Colletotrichum tropicale]|nr:hypothetical protein N0V92_011771 [Colletotrichum tropicale]
MTREEVQEIAAKGGHASHAGGFASMDPERQVRLFVVAAKVPSLSAIVMVASTILERRFADRFCLSQREIASEGGKASSGSFEPGSEKAREAGRKGGLTSGSA